MGDERERLWQRWRELDKNLDRYAARRPRDTAVVVLEARDVRAGHNPPSSGALEPNGADRDFSRYRG